MKLSPLERIFFKIKDEVEKTNDNKKTLSVNLTPRFGNVGMFVWYVLEKLRGDEM